MHARTHARTHQVDCVFGAASAQGSVILALIAPPLGMLFFGALFLVLQLIRRPLRKEPQGFPTAALKSVDREVSVGNRTFTMAALSVRNHRSLLLLFESTSREQLKILAAAYVKMLFGAYPFFCVQFLSTIFGCKELNDDSSRLVRFPSEDCHEHNWNTVLLFVVLKTP